MKDKPLMIVLRRENRGIKDDPQYSPYMLGDRYIVFHDYGHPTHTANTAFRTKRAAIAWIAEMRQKVAGGGGLGGVL